MITGQLLLIAVSAASLISILADVVPPDRAGRAERASYSQYPWKVAFFAGRPSNFGPVNQDTDLILDKVITNNGSGYDVRYGRFTAPLRATYHFTIVLTSQPSKQAIVNVLKNGERVSSVLAHSSPNLYAMGTGVVILSLEVDDQVWLQLRKESSHVYGNMYTSFSGFLLFEN